MKWYAIVVGMLACFCVAEACNQALCAPLVSKCLLIKCCECDMKPRDMKNCTCCRACQVCLAKLYTECCSCVGLCPPPDPDDGMYQTSSIENLPDPIPDLFAVLTEEKDVQRRWTTHTYSIDLDNLLFKPGTGHTSELHTAYIEKEEPGTGGKKTEQPASTVDPATAVMGVHNCSVAFFSQCMSIRKCKTSCKSMGAAKYRWFHDAGCCQCVGSTCIDFGLNEPRCLNCPPGSHTDVDLDNIDSDFIYDELIENGNSVEIADKSENVKHQAGIVSGPGKV